MHPAASPEEDLIRACEWSTQRRGGPGGQHRNKVETAVILHHRESGLTVEANERRSQSENRRVALVRLRIQLAIHYRSPESSSAPSCAWQDAVVQGRLRVSDRNESFPAILAELLDYLNLRDYSLQEAASYFGTSTSQLVRFLKKCPAAFDLLNDQRQRRGLGHLK